MLVSHSLQSSVTGVTDRQQHAVIERKKDEVATASEVFFVENTEEWDTDHFGSWSVNGDQGYKFWSKRFALTDI